MKEASSPQTTSHGDTHRASRRPDSNHSAPDPVPVNALGLEPAAFSNGSPSLSAPNGGPGAGGASSAQPAPAADPDSSSSPRRAVNTPPAAHPGPVVGSDTEKSVTQKEKKPVMQRFWHTSKAIVFSSKINVLLVFVPVGIAVAQIHSLPPAVIFAMNAVAIVPLAGLLSFATESVAHRLGDSLGALINVTFGNAVELIIFIIALVKNEIRIVQASLLGSILANLLLILGMSFFLGGLRYREQIYNSTVTQMSACLLSLSVISLVLPTAFHASFSDYDLADEQSLKVSRGTSVVSKSGSNYLD
jgi:Ca2+:H+ antiporter